MRYLILGGSTGLGRELVNALTKDGHTVCYLSRTEGAPVPLATHVPCDLAGPEAEIQEAVKAALEILGSLDAVVFSAGMGAYESPLVNAEKVSKLFQTNVLGPLVAFRACYKALLRSKGKAVFITSTAARKPGSGGLSYYAATKAAIHGFVISEGRRAAKKGVAVCAVAPGFFSSPMTAEMVPALREATERAIPFGRWGTPDEVGRFVVGLLDQTNWTLAGSIFEISGGA